MKLANPNGAPALWRKQVGNDAALSAIKARASERADKLRAIVADIRHQGRTSVRTMADGLNDAQS